MSSSESNKMSYDSTEIKKYKDHIISYYKKKEKPLEIDRRKTCPFLMRVFYGENQFNQLEYFKHNNFPSKELNIYTWMDATLRELTNLIQGTLNLSKKCIYVFSIVFYDSTGQLQRKEIGDVYLNRNTPFELLTLKDIHFIIGDYMDIKLIMRSD